MSCHHRLVQRLRRAVRLWLGHPVYRRVYISGSNFRFLSILLEKESSVGITLRDTDPGMTISLSTKKDAAGFCPPAGEIEWTCSDPSVVAITPATHGLSCTVRPAQPVKLGSATVTAKDTTDPDLPPLVFNVDVIAGKLSGYDATITPLPAPKAEAATDEHQVVS